MKRVLLMLLPLFLCGAASFNGTTQGAGTTVAAPLGTNIVTVSLWVQHNTTNITKLMLEHSANVASVNNSFYFAAEGGSVPSNFESFAMKGTTISVWRRSVPMVLGVMSHRVIVYNKSDTTGYLTLYVDGVPEAVTLRPYPSLTAVGSSANFSDQRIFVGARNITSARFAGLIQDLAIYAGEVSAAEAYALGAQRMSPLKVRSAKLLYYWPFSAGENPSNSPDLVGGIPVNSGTKSITTEQAPTFRK